MTAFWRSLIFVFLSEMGDKTQIVSFAFGTTYGLPVVMIGIFIAVAALMGVSVGVGTAAASMIPRFWLNLFSGILFLLFGYWAVKPGKEEQDDEGKPLAAKFGPLVAVMATFFIAELGDKTVLAGIAMGSQFHAYLPVWAGSTLGMYLADLIAVFCGMVLGKRLPEKLVRYMSAAIFFGAGIYTIIVAFQSR